MNIKCVIIDDEPIAIDILTDYISRIPYLKLAAAFTNGIDALKYANSNSIDVLFIDIQMPDINGMDFLRLMNKKTNVVFTTAYPEHALKSYEFNPLDYLVKPISFDLFMRAISRVQNLNTPALESTRNTDDHIFIKANGKTIRLQLSDLLYVEGLKDYVIFHTTEAHYISYHGMKEIEDKLPEDKFIRIHKSHIISLDMIQEIEGNEVKIGGKKIPIGRQYKPLFLKIIEQKKI